MKLKWIPILIGSNLLTLATLLYVFLGGSVSTSPGDAHDQRTIVYLTAGQKALLLSEMRQLLDATRGVLHQLNESDHEAAAKIASSVGMRMAREVGGEHPGIIKSLPVAMRKLGFSVHGDFDDLAEHLRSANPDSAEAYRSITATLTKCVACHASYRLEIPTEAARPD